MPTEPSHLEQAVSRTLRDNLERLQRTTEELSAAIADVVSACASTRPTNALPSMIRAQVSAASLAASLEVLTKFVTRALQPPPETAEAKSRVSAIAFEVPERPAAPPSIPTPMAEVAAPVVDMPAEAVADRAEPAPEMVVVDEVEVVEEIEETEETEAPEKVVLDDSADQVAEEVAEQAAAAEFDIAALSAEEQELHRRANRVAKVSMQDIKLLKPEQTRLGREHNDLCVRLRDDIEKAHVEYERRFRPILGHPVDYFHHWMVEILGGGDPQTLGEYPYTSSVARH
jgi:hypothetical protein